MSRTTPPKVRPDWRRAGCTSARGCPGGTWCGQPRPISRLDRAGTRALSALGLALSPLVSPWPRHRRVHSSGSSANWSRHTSPSEMRISDAARASGCSARPRLRPSRLSRCERAGREIAASTSRRVCGLCTGGASNVYLLCTCGNYMQYAAGVFRICSPNLRRLWVAMADELRSLWLCQIDPRIALVLIFAERKRTTDSSVHSPSSGRSARACAVNKASLSTACCSEQGPRPDSAQAHARYGF